LSAGASRSAPGTPPVQDCQSKRWGLNASMALGTHVPAYFPEPASVYRLLKQNLLMTHPCDVFSRAPCGVFQMSQLKVAGVSIAYHARRRL
jgi:hypothetical protein